MNDIANTKLDILWTLAADEYVKDLIRESRVPHPDTVIDEWTEGKILRMIRKERNRTKRRHVWKYLRIALVACLVLATLALAACMAFPTVREAIWQVVLDWGDESVKIQFVPAEDPDYNNAAVTTSSDPAGTTTTDSSDEPDEPIPEPPTSIQEINIPSYVPAGYTVQSKTMRKAYIVDYLNSNGAVVATFKQMTFSAGSEGDATEGIATDVEVNGLNAVLFTYQDSPNVYQLYWQDTQYKYCIYGNFESYEELLRMANSVTVK